MIEEWKDIPGFEGKYQISNLGKVRSKNKILKTEISNTGYERVYLSVARRIGVKKSIHRMVAEVFVDNPYHKKQVNHKDGDKTNNVYTNLEWCTQSENVRHAYETGLTKPRKKEVYQFDTKGNFIRKWESVKELSKSKIMSASTLEKKMIHGKFCYRGYIWIVEESEAEDMIAEMNMLCAVFSQLNIQGIKPWNDRTLEEQYELTALGRK